MPTARIFKLIFMEEFGIIFNPELEPVFTEFVLRFDVEVLDKKIWKGDIAARVKCDLRTSIKLVRHMAGIHEESFIIL